MKKITFTFFLLISIDAYALPDCPGMDELIWNNCFGTYTWRDGDKYVGEYKDGKRHGQGTFTFVDGTRDAGFYMNDEYVPDMCEDMGLSVNSSGYENCINRLIEAVLD